VTGALLSLAGSALGAVKSNWLPWALIAALALALAGAIWRADHLSGALALERAEHRTTQEALTVATEKGLGWKTAYEEAFEAARARSAAAQACLDRAAEAEQARKEREALLQAAPPRPRTEAEKQEVVNDATRQRAADRLNRAF
jgi:hypothetical protein